jgi:hypothetical protein
MRSEVECFPKETRAVKPIEELPAVFEIVERVSAYREKTRKDITSRLHLPQMNRLCIEGPCLTLRSIA